MLAGRRQQLLLFKAMLVTADLQPGGGSTTALLNVLLVAADGLKAALKAQQL